MIAFVSESTHLVSLVFIKEMILNDKVKLVDAPV